MRTCLDTCVVPVDIPYPDGSDDNRRVTVTVTYRVEVDSAYGEDADGRRGERRVEVEAVDTELDPADVARLTPWQVARITVEAMEKVERNPPYY